MTNMLEFRTEDGEKCLMDLKMVLCIFPDERRIMTIAGGWAVTVHAEDFPSVEQRYRDSFPRFGEERG